jgi:NDP-sugar pyrophosphorylase family protein
MQTTLLVLAAGMGSRYGGLKQIEPVGPNGEVILEYSVHDAIRAGFTRVVFVIRRDIEDAFRKSIGSRFDRTIPVEYAFQDLEDLPAGQSIPTGREKPWGTGHAILAARNHVNGAFAVINADDFYGPAAYALLGTHLASARDTDRADYAMVSYRLNNTLSDHGSVSRGICECDRNGFLTRVEECVAIVRDGENARYTGNDGSENRLPGELRVSMNFWGFTPSIFVHLESEFRRFLSKQGKALNSEFYIPTVVGDLVERGAARVAVLDSPDAWFGITHPQDKAQAILKIRGLIAAGHYPESLSAVP